MLRGGLLMLLLYLRRCEVVRLGSFRWKGFFGSLNFHLLTTDRNRFISNDNRNRTE
jgi:hypothetical protein